MPGEDYPDEPQGSDWETLAHLEHLAQIGEPEIEATDDFTENDRRQAAKRIERAFPGGLVGSDEEAEPPNNVTNILGN